MRTRIEKSALVGAYNLISNRTDKVLLFAESMTVCSEVQIAFETNEPPITEAAEVAAFITD